MKSIQPFSNSLFTVSLPYLQPDCWVVGSDLTCCEYIIHRQYPRFIAKFTYDSRCFYDPAQDGKLSEIPVILFNGFEWLDEEPDSNMLTALLDEAVTVIGYHKYRDDCFEAAYDAGYDAGCEDGYNDGYEGGYEDGHEIGNIDGYRIGFEDGYEEGYADG